jgi:CheY-like chemotaxis protein
LAEDSPDDEFVFLEIIRRSGIQNPVMVVHDGDDAIAYLKREGKFADPEASPLPSAIFIDLKMPKVGGFEVLRWIKTQPSLKDILLVILTHRHEVNIIKEAYELGAHSFLTKPLTQAELNNLILHFQAHFHGCDEQHLPVIPFPASADEFKLIPPHPLPQCKANFEQN